MSVVNGWLDNVAYAHSDSNNTRENYKAQLTFFCNFINCSPRGILEDYEKAENEREFKRKYAGLVRNWISQLHSKGYSSGTIQCYVASVKSFFKYNDLPLAYVPTAKTRITYHNRDIKCGEITDILQASRPRDRAFARARQRRYVKRQLLNTGRHDRYRAETVSMLTPDQISELMEKNFIMPR